MRYLLLAALLILAGCCPTAKPPEPPLTTRALVYLHVPQQGVQVGDETTHNGQKVRVVWVDNKITHTQFDGISRHSMWVEVEPIQ